jgi:hypothetical protein
MFLGKKKRGGGITHTSGTCGWCVVGQTQYHKLEFDGSQHLKFSLNIHKPLERYNWSIGSNSKVGAMCAKF